MPRRRLLVSLAGLGLLGLALLAVRGRLDGRLALEWIHSWGPWAPFLFVVVYVAACLLLLPAVPLTLGAGAVFGVVPGTVYVSLASTIGATAAFLIARHVGRAAVERRVRTWPAFRGIDEAVSREGWKIVVLTRLSPLFPFNLLNIAFGITRVPLWHYVFASWLGMLPATVLYVYLGSLAGSLVAEPREKSTAEWVILGIGLVATLLVTIVVTRMARRALPQHLPPSPNLAP